jgi:hypothetical protein
MQENQDFEFELRLLEEGLNELGALKRPVAFDFLNIQKAAPAQKFQDEVHYQSNGSFRQKENSTMNNNQSSSKQLLGYRNDNILSKSQLPKANTSKIDQFFEIRQMSQKLAY